MLALRSGYLRLLLMWPQLSAQKGGSSQSGCCPAFRTVCYPARHVNSGIDEVPGNRLHGCWAVPTLAPP